MKKLFVTLLLSGFLLPVQTSAISLSTVPDCDDNAVIRCGLEDTSAAASGYAQPGAADIYSYFGISGGDIRNLDNQAVSGRVTADGRVIVNSKVVATNAITAGRQNIPGSTRISSGGTVFYTRPPSVSFQTSSLPAYVVMSNGRFSYAIIASCGNPVMATPVVKTVVRAKAVPAAAASLPASSPVLTQTQTQTVYVNQSAPPQVQAETTAVAPPKTLPNTGPGDIVGFTGVTAMLSGLGHFLYTRRRGTIQ